MHIKHQILTHAAAVYPQECCGFVIDTAGGRRFLPAENIAADPLNYFEISPEAYLNAHAAGEVVAVVHSHPDGDACLSAADRLMQRQSGLDWWLATGGAVKRFKNRPHLLGRAFVHGEMDCYTLFQDAYMLAGLEMDDFHRPDLWWENGGNLYLDNMPGQGFKRLSGGAEIQLGDVMLMQIGADVPNHAAIYLGNGQVLHHAPKRLSKRDFYDGYWLKHTHSIWRHKDADRLCFQGILNDMEATDGTHSS